MPSPAEACLRVPTFLGVHTLALSEELTLDGGAVVSGCECVGADDGVRVRVSAYTLLVQPAGCHLIPRPAALHRAAAVWLFGFMAITAHVPIYM